MQHTQKQLDSSDIKKLARAAKDLMSNHTTSSLIKFKELSDECFGVKKEKE